MRSYYALLQYEFMETGEINEDYLHDWGQSGLSSFQLSGQKITLKAGSIWVRQNDDKVETGYNILYACNDYHDKCKLILPMNPTS